MTSIYRTGTWSKKHAGDLPLRGKKIAFADTLRGIAALMVVLGHHLGVFWLGQPYVHIQTGMPVLPVKVVPVYTSIVTTIPHLNWGIFGVAVFFLISGFVIPFSFDRTGGLPFLVGRFFRLVPTFAVGTLATIAVLFGASRYFGYDLAYSLGRVIANLVPGARDLAWSPVINPIVWTLEVEVKFYLICAVLAPLLRVRSKWVFLIPVLLVVYALGFIEVAPALKPIGGYIYTLPFTVAHAVPFLLFMFIGVAFHYMWRSAMGPQELLATAFLLFGAMAYVWSRQGEGLISVYFWTYGWGVGIFGLVASLPERWVTNRVTEFFADISYPLYVVHCLIGYVGLRILYDLGSKMWLAHLVMLAVVILLAAAIHRWVEQPTHELGRAIMARMTNRVAVAA